METLHLQYPMKAEKQSDPKVIALGYFDGVHKGHLKVMNTALEIAKKLDCKSAVMTFDPHPSLVLGKYEEMKYITPIEIKKKIIANLGFDRLYIVSFTKEFAQLTPREFVEYFLIGQNVKHVVAGFDFTYGHLGAGNMETLRIQAENRFGVTLIDKVTKGEEKVSSTLIRSCILEGSMEEIPGLLGRYYHVVGNVVHGEKRGRTIGFPTANIEVDDLYLLPPTGVYAVKLRVDETWFNGVCNIGYKPTFHDDRSRQSIEVHVFDFNSDIYGKKVVIEWHRQIRRERKFNSVNELIDQIHLDKETARGILTT